MPEKFKILLLFLFFFIFKIYTIEDKNLSIYFLYNKNIKTDSYLSVNYLIDSYESNAISKYNEINFKFNYEKYEVLNIKQISNNVFSKGGNCYYIFDSSNDIIDIKLYTVYNEIVYSEKIVVNKDDLDSLSKNLDKYLNSLDLFLALKSKYTNKISSYNFTFLHDFPYINISITAVSLKFYFDGRTTSKMFSFFPIDFRLSYYPIKYLEIGAFIRFDVGEMVYRYIDIKDGFSRFYESSFDFSYGFFCGFSLFSNISHYSIGLQFYNLYYNISATKYIKSDNINSYFLPQISLYQKLDLKLYKFMNYSIFINIKTMPLYYLDSDMNFYSNPFSYDFPIIEFSLIGFSITF